MQKIVEKFKKEGWCIVDFDNPSSVFEAKKSLQNKLNELLGKQCPLEQYHTSADDDKFHTETQIQMTQFFRNHRFGPKIIEAQLPIFQSFLGLDLSVQSHPYLRMTRPNKPQDNIGYHRDTFYGGSPYELSVLIPFVDVPAVSSLQVLTGSHIHPEKRYPVQQVPNPDTEVTKGSAKHQLGFLYSPKIMDAGIERYMQGIPLKVGQALIFSLSLVHGSIVNKGLVTRWSTDIRVMNSFAPVDLKARPTYYEILSQSIVTQNVKEYEKNNEQDC